MYCKRCHQGLDFKAPGRNIISFVQEEIARCKREGQHKSANDRLYHGYILLQICGPGGSVGSWHDLL